MTRIAGYADRVSVTPGETINFMVSCEAPSYKCDIVRLVCGDENPDGPGVKEKVVRTGASGTYKGRRQVCYDGSFMEVPAHPAIQGLESFTIPGLHLADDARSRHPGADLQLARPRQGRCRAHHHQERRLARALPRRRRRAISR